ncbi:MAG: hypothetical protein II266_08325, partial [Clostridia bacterium]|nr:hypothetical protein [Clostridia bacterium]
MKSRMYVPVMNGMVAKHREEYKEMFEKIGDMHPVLCIERTFDDEKSEKNLDMLEDNIEFVKSLGYTPFVWAQALGFGIPLEENESRIAEKFERITDFDGVKLG